MTSALFVSHTAERGGAELFLLDLLKGCNEAWQACFLAGGPAADALADADRPPILIEAGARMLSVRRGASPAALLHSAGDVAAAAFRLARKAKPYDVICANSQKALFACALAARLCRKPLVWFLHDIMTDAAFSPANRRAALGFARLFAHRVAVNSLATGDAFIAAGGQARKVRLVYNGFDAPAICERQKDKAAALRKTLGLGPGPLIGVFGRLAEWKGQHVLLDALADLPNVQAVIAGAALFGEETYEAQLRARACRLGLDGRVRFLGFRDDVSALMAMTDIVVHTSIAEEPFGRVIVEAMLAGRPVIATRGGGVGEIIHDGKTGLLVPPGDAGALGAAIARLLGNPGAAGAMAAAARADAARRFSLEASRKSVADLLAEVA